MEANIWTANIQIWLDRRKNASLGLLAKRADIPYPTLRRVFQGERRPSYVTAVKIAFETMRADAAITVLEKEYGQPAGLAKALLKGNGKPVSAEEGKHIERLDDFIINGMSLSKCGTTRERIYTRLGNDGIDRLNKLLERNVLSEWNGIILPTSDQKFLTDYRDIVARAKFSLDLHDEESISRAGSFGYFGMGGLNAEGKERIELVLRQARDTIMNVFKDESFGGELVLAVAISSVLVTKH